MNASQMHMFEINHEDVADILSVMGRTDLNDKIYDIIDLINSDAVINIACNKDNKINFDYAHAEIIAQIDSMLTNGAI